MNFAMGLLIGLLLGFVAGISFALPSFGGAVSRFLSVVLIGLGVGILTWALVLGETGEPLRGLFGSNVIEYRSEAFGWAGGLLVGGLFTGIFAFLRRGSTSEGTSNPR